MESADSVSIKSGADQTRIWVAKSLYVQVKLAYVATKAQGTNWP